jgi:hypothetical protein
LKDPAHRKAALGEAKRFPRQHPLEAAVIGGSAILAVITLWLLGAVIVGALRGVSPYALVEVDCTPQASVRVNGKEMGKTPQRLQLRPGRVKLEVYDETLGFHRTETFEAHLGKNPPREFEIGQAKVEFNVLPSAAVYVDGRRLGQTPFPAVMLYEGRHALRLVNPATKEEISEELVVRADQDQIVEKSFGKP